MRDSAKPCSLARLRRDGVSSASKRPSSSTSLTS